MNPVNDSLVVGILITLVFGAICFYLYSRIAQSEKRVSLLENLLLDLKMTTEAQLMGAEMLGPDSVEPISGPSPLDTEDVDGTIDEKYYESMLRDIPGPRSTQGSSVHDPPPPVSSREAPTLESSPSPTVEQVLEEARAAAAQFTRARIENNYESMSVKELQAAVKQRGITPVPRVRKDLIDVLKRHDAGETLSQPVETSAPRSGPLDTFTNANARNSDSESGENEFSLQLEGESGIDAIIDRQFGGLSSVDE